MSFPRFSYVSGAQKTNLRNKALKNDIFLRELAWLDDLLKNASMNNLSKVLGSLVRSDAVQAMVNGGGPVLFTEMKETYYPISKPMSRESEMAFRLHLPPFSDTIVQELWNLKGVTVYAVEMNADSPQVIVVSEKQNEADVLWYQKSDGTSGQMSLEPNTAWHYLYGLMCQAFRHRDERALAAVIDWVRKAYEKLLVLRTEAFEASDVVTSTGPGYPLYGLLAMHPDGDEARVYTPVHLTDGVMQIPSEMIWCDEADTDLEWRLNLLFSGQIGDNMDKLSTKLQRLLQEKGRAVLVRYTHWYTKEDGSEYYIVKYVLVCHERQIVPCLAALGEPQLWRW